MNYYGICAVVITGFINLYIELFKYPIKYFNTHPRFVIHRKWRAAAVARTIYIKVRRKYKKKFATKFHVNQLMGALFIFRLLLSFGSIVNIIYQNSEPFHNDVKIFIDKYKAISNKSVQYLISSSPFVVGSHVISRKVKLIYQSPIFPVFCFAYPKLKLG